jgi:ABC-type dipeptide/oligopeptide/nickel transport system permease component
MSFRLFILRRLLYMLLTKVLVTIAVFSILQLIPGNPADALLHIHASARLISGSACASRP